MSSSSLYGPPPVSPGPPPVTGSLVKSSSKMLLFADDDRLHCVREAEGQRFVVLSRAEFADARLPEHEAHAQPAGRLHRLLLPRLHLRSEPVPPQQPPGRERSHETAGRIRSRSLPIQLPQLPQVNGHRRRRPASAAAGGFRAWRERSFQSEPPRRPGERSHLRVWKVEQIRFGPSSCPAPRTKKGPRTRQIEFDSESGRKGGL